ncbi:hypothetical protein KKF84_11470, partial [Myxococcota bacterium]|nr:hypothetical protein [Myxococcota bacterium]
EAQVARIDERTESLRALFTTMHAENTRRLDSQDQKLDKLIRAMIIYSVDPIGMGFDFNVRYGVWDRFDIGYKMDSGVHVFDTRFQFAGPTKQSPNFLGINLGPHWFGSIGVQYSQQDFEIPLPGLDKLQKLIGYKFEKQDILIPIAFSYSLWGNEEKFGSVSFGAAYNYSRLKWGLDEGLIQDLFVDTLASMGITVPGGDQAVHSFGGFVNIKLGYKYVYVIASLSVYYQNYGKFRLFDYSASYSGVTFVPTIGVVGQFFGM